MNPESRVALLDDLLTTTGWQTETLSVSMSCFASYMKKRPSTAKLILRKRVHISGYLCCERTSLMSLSVCNEVTSTKCCLIISFW